MLRRLAPAGLRRRYRRWLVDEFTTYYYNSGRWQQTSWLGVPIKQAPTDVLVLQQIVWETLPDLIVETGTFHGGSAMLFAHVFDAIGHGSVVSIDIDHDPVLEQVRDHPRVQLLTADSTSPDTAGLIAELAAGKRTMIHLDASHRDDFVLAELRALAPHVTPGCYAVVADSIMGGHPVPFVYEGVKEEYPGPWAAVHRYLAENPDFEVDESRQHHLLTFNPRGYLRRRG